MMNQHQQQIIARLEQFRAAFAKLPSRVCLETNEGTFGANECLRRTGLGDARYGNYSVYLDLDTKAITRVGCDADHAPGYARHTGSKSVDRLVNQRKMARAEIARLEKLLELSHQHPCQSVPATLLSPTCGLRDLGEMAS